MRAPKQSRTVIPVQSGSSRSGRLLFMLGLYSLVIVLAIAATAIVVYFMRRVGLPGWGGRYLVLAIWFFLIVLDLGVRHVRTAFGLKDYRTAARWLYASLLSPGLSGLKLWDTNLKPDPLEAPNLIKTIGGPGSVTIAPGLVALVESLDGNIRVLEKGNHLLGRLEWVKAVIRPDEVLADQVERKQAVTRDGIVIDATDIRFQYRLNRTGLSLEEAVKRRVYNLAQDAKGDTDWAASVRGAVTSQITGAISENLLDNLTAAGFAKNKVSPATPRQPEPPKTDPRAEIIKRVNTKGKDALTNLGADLAWFDIGHFDLPQQVNAKRAETWQKTWEGSLEILRAKKEAARIRYRRAYTLGRTEAQIDLLIKFVKGLDGLNNKSPLPANGVSVFITGVTQLLDALGKDAGDQAALGKGALGEPKNPPSPSS